MKKIATLAYIGSLIGLTMYALTHDSYYINLLIGLATPLMIIRTFVILTIAAYVFVPKLRIIETRIFITLVGLTMLALGLTSIFNPSIMGYSINYILLGDALLFIEGGIFTLILSSELPYRQTSVISNILTAIKSRYYDAEPRRMPYVPLHSNKTLKPRY